MIYLGCLAFGIPARDTIPEKIQGEVRIPRSRHPGGDWNPLERVICNRAECQFFGGLFFRKENLIHHHSKAWAFCDKKTPKLFDSFASEGFSDDLNMVVRG